MGFRPIAHATWAMSIVSKAIIRPRAKRIAKRLQIFVGLGHRRGIARALEGFACLAVAQSRAARALTLAAAAASLRHLINTPLTQAEQLKFERTLLPAWKSLNGPEGQRAWAEGSAMGSEKAVHYALEELGSAISSQNS